jgi:rRNA-processing protein CGR1
VADIVFSQPAVGQRIWRYVGLAKVQVELLPDSAPPLAFALQVEQERGVMDEGEAAAAVAAEVTRVCKRAKHNVVGAGKASGRDWKVPGQRAGSLKNPKLSTSWEKKMADKAQESAFKEQKRAALAAAKEAAAEVRRKKEAAKQRKKEAQERSAVVTRVSAATAKRMMKSKKGRKLLQTRDVQ